MCKYKKLQSYINFMHGTKTKIHISLQPTTYDIFIHFNINLHLTQNYSLLL